MGDVMRYDILGGVALDDVEDVKFFTIGDLLDLADANRGKQFVFLGDEYTVGELMSWRGSYDLPAIGYECLPAKTGEEVFDCISEGLKGTHFGWKGGEYTYTKDDLFYVANSGQSGEYRVCGYKEDYCKIVLLTRLDPY